MAASTRTHKRPFQPSITSYFGHADEETRSPPPAVAPSIPLIPGVVQSSLLNVGMRVRKSVPEGYKTKTRRVPDPLTDLGENTLPMNQRVHRKAGVGFTELTPYCGILDVGGHAPLAVLENEDIPPFHVNGENCSSQKFTLSPTSTSLTPSTLSDAPLKAGTTKRSREESDEEITLSGICCHDDLNCRAFSPPHHPTTLFRMSILDTMRPKVQPKSRKPSPPVSSPSMHAQEIEMKDVGDFEEADFFRPDEWEDREGKMLGL
ncbi:hypothetical protein MMC12_008320 [Toensbergia leucococca]|nr:hypothetical protein [Toensbergia leucococca]